MEASAPKGGMARFDTRLTHEQKLMFEQAAALGGFRTLTEFVITAVQKHARQIIAEKEAFLVTEQDREIFFQEMLNPRDPNEYLVAAAQKYKQALKTNGISDSGLSKNS